MAIESLALELVALKKAASEALAKGEIEAFLDASAKEIQIQKKLRFEIANRNFVEVDSKAAKDVLRKIRSEVAEEEQAMDEILSHIEDEGTSGLLVESAADIDELTGQLLFSWFNPRDYVLGLFRTGAVIIRCGVPYELKSLVEEARRCFAFQQYNAVISLCRTILEAAVTDIGVRTGAIPKGAVNRRDFYRQYPPWGRIDAVTTGQLRQQMHDFYDTASEIIHGRKTAGTVSSLEALKATLHMIEQLYSQHGQVISSPNQ